ncbi:cytochrome P450 94C1-like [Lolium rigidum]|uniref:cytochrome P450 94C1-like n=1 Tax=Lolium rigidum TaxID=89674 RepID=UPI001F5C9B91|nr:cytochrome P450 94C1-like [Lolium rigidum]
MDAVTSSTATATAMEELPWCTQCAGLAFLGFSLCVVALGAVLLLARRWPWCSCHVCRSYLTGSWARDFTNLGDWYAHLLRESPTGTVTVHVLGCTVTANPANVEHMLRTRFDNYPKGKPFAAVLGDLLGGGIFNVDGDAWRHQRKMASLELGSVAVRSYAYGIVAGEVEARLLPVLADAADNARVLDLQDVFRRFAFDTICKISFGLDPGCLELDMPMSKLAAAFDTASRLSAMRGAASSPLVWKAKRMLNVGSERELSKSIRLVDELAAAMIRQRRKLGVAGSHDLLSRFMASEAHGAGAVDDKYLRDIVVSFLLAGRDTVASALTTIFMLLSKNPAVAAAMRAEDAARDNTTPTSRTTYEHLKSLHYTHAVLYENMRLFPPVQFDSKFCAAADVLPDGTYVSASQRVMYHPYAMGRMPRIWGADYDKFRPERWLTGAGGTFAPESLYRYPVFQAGLRVCLGKELAVMEMKAVSVAVVRMFDVEVVGENGAGAAAPRFAPGLTASISGGLPVRVRRV